MHKNFHINLPNRTLSPPPVVSFSRPKNRKINRENERIGGLLIRIEEIRDLHKIVSISIVIMKQMEEIGDFRLSSSIG